MRYGAWNMELARKVIPPSAYGKKNYAVVD